MAVLKGINSYVSFNEADKYFETRLDSQAWQTKEDDIKESALVTATSLLDKLTWKGKVVKETGLSWPRKGFFSNSSWGVQTKFNSGYSFSDLGIETEISLTKDLRMLRNATYELCIHLLTNEDVINPTDTVEGLKVGSVSLYTITAVSVVPSNILNIVQDMLSYSNFRWEGY